MTELWMIIIMLKVKAAICDIIKFLIKRPNCVTYKISSKIFVGQIHSESLLINFLLID